MIVVRGYDRITSTHRKKLVYDKIKDFSEEFLSEIMEQWLTCLNIKVFAINKIGEEIQIGQFNEEDYHTALTLGILTDKYIEYGENQDLKGIK